MSTVRVVVNRSHRHSSDRIVQVGEILDLPEHVAVERMTTNAVRLAPAAASETGTADVTVPAGVASASPAGADGTAEEPVADGVQPAAPDDPPTAAQPSKTNRKSSK